MFSYDVLTILRRFFFFFYQETPQLFFLRALGRTRYTLGYIGIVLYLNWKQMPECPDTMLSRSLTSCDIEKW